MQRTVLINSDQFWVDVDGLSGAVDGLLRKGEEIDRLSGEVSGLTGAGILQHALGQDSEGRAMAALVQTNSADLFDRVRGWAASVRAAGESIETSAHVLRTAEDHNQRLADGLISSSPTSSGGRSDRNPNRSSMANLGHDDASTDLVFNSRNSRPVR